MNRKKLSQWLPKTFASSLIGRSWTDYRFGRSGPHMASSAHVSDLGGVRADWQAHRNGGIRLCLWCSESRQHLVSHQFSRAVAYRESLSSGQRSSIHFVPTVSRSFVLHGLVSILLGWSTAQCFPCCTPSIVVGDYCPRVVVGAALPNPRLLNPCSRPTSDWFWFVLASGIWNRGRLVSWRTSRVFLPIPNATCEARTRTNRCGREQRIQTGRDWVKQPRPQHGGK